MIYKFTWNIDYTIILIIQIILIYAVRVGNGPKINKYKNDITSDEPASFFRPGKITKNYDYTMCTNITVKVFTFDFILYNCNVVMCSNTKLNILCEVCCTEVTKNTL